MEPKYTIDKIVDSFLGLFKLNTPPLAPLPPPLLLVGGNIRPGLSARRIAEDIVKGLAEAGIPVGAGSTPDGSVNLSVEAEKIRVEKIIEALITEAKIEITITPGTKVVATGFAGPFPAVVAGTILGIGTGTGVIR